MGDFLATLRDVNLAGLADGAGIYWDATAKQWKAVPSAWTAYTPVWTATSVAPTLGNGTDAGAYRQTGKTIDFRISITFGTTTTFGSGNYRLGLPVSPVSIAVNVVGVLNTNTGLQEGFVGLYEGVVSGGQAVVMLIDSATVLGSSNGRLVSGATLVVAGTYEAA